MKNNVSNIFQYQERVIIQFSDKTRLSLASGKYAKLLPVLTEQIRKTGIKLGNPFKIFNKKVYVFIYKKKTKTYHYTIMDIPTWKKINTFTLTFNSNGYIKYYDTNHKEERLLHRLASNYYNLDKTITQQYGLVVDHINGNICDNTFSNLRLTTLFFNCRNKTTNFLDSKSGIMGLTEREGYYEVRVRGLHTEHTSSYKFYDMQEAIEFNRAIRKKLKYIDRE